MLQVDRCRFMVTICGRQEIRISSTPSTGYHTATTNFARQLLGAMAWALGLDARYFEAKVIEPLAHLRLWKYPPPHWACTAQRSWVFNCLTAR